MPPEAGFFDVVVHGDPSSFYLLHNGSWVPVKPNSLRTYLKRQPAYKGQPIRLISCESGAKTNGIAQSMANGLGVQVKAPTETVWIMPDGKLVVGADPAKPSGSWVDFQPGKPVMESPAAKPDPHVQVPDAPAPDVATPPRETTPTPSPTDAGLVAAGKKGGKGGGSAPAVKPQVKTKKTSSELPPRKSDRKFRDAALEAAYQKYRHKKKLGEETPRTRKSWYERVRWWQHFSPVVRGNKFNQSVKKRKLYPYNEVNILKPSAGKKNATAKDKAGYRLDSYDPDEGVRVSRKATDFDKITEGEFTRYVKEIDEKYPVGAEIRSDTNRPIDGQMLTGRAVLEVPASNLENTNPEFVKIRERFEQIAAENNVELRYTAEK